jgi:hypothetical protein
MTIAVIELVSVAEASRVLTGRHYLGPTSKAAFALRDEHGVIVFARPRGRHVPTGWLEVVRWCLVDGKGSVQWAAALPFLRREFPGCSTIISYSDPSVGHTGALYRACNWLWAPTWHRLRPPPTGNGAWSEDKTQSVKDRWIFPLHPDPDRAAAIVVKDDAVLKLMPWASYREPVWRKGRFDPKTGGGDYKRFISKPDEPRTGKAARV